MTDKYAVIGNPISQSKSPLIHTTFARQTGQDLDYTSIAGQLGGFRDNAERFRKEGGRGLNVTTPFKLDAFEYVTDLHEQARLAGAVNALKFEGERIYGQNFDGIGVVRDIVCNLETPMQGKRVLLLGAGGAVRGAMLPILQQQPDRLLLVNRMESKAQILFEQFETYATGDFSYGSYSDLSVMQERFDLVINGTSATLHGEVLPIPAGVFTNSLLAYDMAYGKGLTPFLKLAQESGAKRIADGVGMLVEQAAEAFAWWRGIRPGTKAMIETLAVPLT